MIPCSDPDRVRILLVEDDAPIREALADLLRDEGYEVTSAEDGRQALDHLQSVLIPHLVLLDLMMPVMDGWQFRAEQKKSPVLQRIPVIVMSANDSPQAVAIDAAEYLPKPISLSQLLKTIHRVLMRTQQAQVANAERMAALGTLAAGIAHEINNPLTYVVTNLCILQQQLPELLGSKRDEMVELVQESLEGTERIARIVRGMQQVFTSRSDEEALPLDVCAALEWSLKVVESEIRHRAKLSCHFGAVPHVLAKHSFLEQVFTNILVNAVQSLPEGRANENLITVATRTDPDGNASIEIADTGNGIPPELREMIFEPFFTTKSFGEGSGLGLPICRELVATLGGRLTFESQPNVGTTFCITFPPASLAVPSAVANARPFPTPGQSRLQVLAIDSDPGVLGALRRLLETDHDIVIAKDKNELQHFLSQLRFDAVLCDLSMPDMTGMDLLDRLERENPDLVRRVIFTTGGAYTASTRAFVQNRDRVVLHKPFTRDALNAALDRVVSAARSVASAADA